MFGRKSLRRDLTGIRYEAVPHNVVRTGSALVLLGLVPACAGRQLAPEGFQPAPPPTAIASLPAGQGVVDATLFLIGDAGLPEAGLPVLEALTDQAAHAEGDVAIVFLGDNLYERGLPPVGDDRRERGEARLQILIDVARKAGVHGVFTPGNHDWDGEGEDGWRAIVDQQQFIDGLQLDSISFLPKGGCPGPEVLDLGHSLRVVILDTQWWLHEGPKPSPENSECVPATEAGVLVGLDRALGGAGDRQTVIAAHHPFDSGGPHGGYFDWRDHFFPLRRVSGPLGWLPIPGFGSFFVLARSVWKPRQDLANRHYRAMIEAIESVAQRHEVVASAGGHDHSLQVLRSQATRYVLVSGTGPSTGLTASASKENTLFVTSRWGFMRLDVLESGRVRLRVYGQDSGGIMREVYWRWLAN